MSKPEKLVEEFEYAVLGATSTGNTDRVRAARKALLTALWAPERRDLARVVIDTIEAVENRCMAVDGPVTPTHAEITDDELRTIYDAALGALRG